MSVTRWLKLTPKKIIAWVIWELEWDFSECYALIEAHPCKDNRVSYINYNEIPVGECYALIEAHLWKIIEWVKTELE